MTVMPKDQEVMNSVKVTKTVVGAVQVGQNPRHMRLTKGVFGSTCQHSLSTVQQQCSSAAEKGWRFVPDAILPGHR